MRLKLFENELRIYFRFTRKYIYINIASRACSRYSNCHRSYSCQSSEHELENLYSIFVRYLYFLCQSVILFEFTLFALIHFFSYVHSLFVIASEYFSLASIFDYLRERFVHLYVLCFSFFSFFHSEFSLTFSSFKSFLRLFQCLDSREKIVTVDMSRNSKSQSLSIDSSSTSESSAQHQ